MARDLPDWGALSAQATVHEITDLGELAVRLGSINSFDRRGDVIWYDDLEGTSLRWVTSVEGLTGSGALSTTTARSGIQSVKLTTGTILDEYTRAYRNFARPAVSNVGFEASFAPDVKANRVWRMQDYDGSTLLEGRVKYDSLAETLSYWSSGGAWTVFATGVALDYYLWCFHTGKLVIDTSSGKYVRFILNGTLYDLSAYDLQSSDDSTNPTLRLEYATYNSEASSARVDYWDDIILTQNEPANP